MSRVPTTWCKMLSSGPGAVCICGAEEVTFVRACSASCMASTSTASAVGVGSPPFLPLVDELPVAGGANPEATTELREVAAAFEMLPEGQRQVLLLVVLEQFSYRQVADILGIPLGTVMSRL